MSETRDFFTIPSPARTACLIASVAASILVMAWVRLELFNDRLIPIGYAIPLCLFLLFRDRRFLWPTVAVFVLISYVKMFYVFPKHNPSNPWRHNYDWAFALDMFDILVIGSVI